MNWWERLLQWTSVWHVRRRAVAEVFVRGRAAVNEEADVEGGSKETSGDLEYWDESEMT
jgi:hypothetical protein